MILYSMFEDFEIVVFRFPEPVLKTPAKKNKPGFYTQLFILFCFSLFCRATPLHHRVPHLTIIITEDKPVEAEPEKKVLSALLIPSSFWIFYLHITLRHNGFHLIINKKPELTI